jgi:multiple sugar transport system ATP-binding protein
MATVTLKNIGAAGLTGVLGLTIHDREFVVLTGPDARECSAIVRIIAGLEDISPGDILFDDRRSNDLPAKDRDVAFLSHDYAPYPGLSVYENLAIGLKRRQFGENEMRKRVMAAAEALAMQDRLEAAAKSLPAAERRFLGLARVMVRQPRVYLFDQPFAGLQPLDASRGRAEIVRLHQRSSGTIIYATPDPAEALALGARTVIIESGVVQQDAGAQSIYDSPANLSVAKFFGDPPMNLVNGTLKQERDGLVFVEAGEGTIALHLPGSHFGAAAELVGKSVVLGFRPEAITVAASTAPAGRSGTAFRALVDRTEARGGQTDLYLQTGSHELVCRTADWRNHSGGSRLQFQIQLEKGHLFASENGRRVTPAP